MKKTDIVIATAAFISVWFIQDINIIRALAGAWLILFCVNIHTLDQNKKILEDYRRMVTNYIWGKNQ